MGIHEEIFEYLEGNLRFFFLESSDILVVGTHFMKHYQKIHPHFKDRPLPHKLQRYEGHE